jgi:hypothetical protein
VLTSLNDLNTAFGGVTVDLSRSHVMGSNDAMLCEAGRATAVSLVGMYHGPGDALGHHLMVSLSNDNLGV